jgi:hypothetical protein
LGAEVTRSFDFLASDTYLVVVLWAGICR